MEFDSSIIDSLKKQENQQKFNDFFTIDGHTILSRLFVKLKANTFFLFG